ncbi:MAG TPA: sulfate adenylyltransferase [Thermoplasmata archaeon]|nr:sulfate adenylyltransferase [Thermoplasmata archaeon]
MPLPVPHGGRLVDRRVPESEVKRRLAERESLPTLRPFVDQLYQIDKIGVGAFSPLEGFMGKEALDSVLDSGRLPGGLPWPMPVILAPVGPENERVVAAARPGDEVLIEDETGDPLAVLHVEEKFPIDRGRLAERTFGTRDLSHPNVADVMAGGETALGGPIDLLRRRSLPAGSEELTPEEVRASFGQRRWTHVAAYQCRNPPHTAHEYLQRLTLDREEIDGLFIQPVVGRLKAGDYRPSVILECYRTLVERYYPKERVMLASLSIAMPYAGPKAALFLAIVRKNFGCSHYIVGRDQAGVGQFYDPYACHRIFDEFDIGVVPLRYLETFYCRRCVGMATPKTCAHPSSDHVDTSQTRIRAALASHQPPPVEILRPEIFAILSRGDVTLPR